MEYLIAFLMFVIGLGYGFALGQLKKQETEHEDYLKSLTKDVVQNLMPGTGIHVELCVNKEKDDDNDGHDDCVPIGPDLRSKWENN